MTTTLFLFFVALMAGVVLWLSFRYLSKRSAFTVTVALIAWLAYVGLIGQTGLLRNTTMRPPGTLFILAPVGLFLAIFAVRTLLTFNRADGVTIPLAMLLAIQAFRIGVELFIHQLWSEGIVPKMLTYSGANVDIWVGATAPLFAWLSTRGKWGWQVSVLWNVLGLLALANVVSRAILTTAGPLNLVHAEVPNQMFGVFPYMFIPGFFVPLAVMLHVAALKKAIGKIQNSYGRSS